MVNISKIEQLIGERGWKKAYFCRLFNHSRTWIDDWKRGRGLPDENVLVCIADKLCTTVEYLMGHATPEMTMGYTHLSQGALSEVREKINAHSSGKVKP